MVVRRTGRPEDDHAAQRSFEQTQAQTQISPDRLRAVEARWRAANHLGVAQLYLRDNALLRRPLQSEDIKPRLRGQWGTQPGLNMIYVHLDRLVQDIEANVLLVVGPGHAAPAVLANLFIEGTLCEYYPQLDRDEAGANELARQFGWPDGVPDHLSPQTPGMIQAGEGLGLTLAHAVGAAFDSPDLTAVCVIDDGEVETGALLAGWQSNRVLNPVRDGAILPILHLGGYTASGPGILGRMDNDEIDNLFTGFGYQIGIVSGDDPRKTHEAMWQAMDWAFGEIRDLQEQARAGGVPERPAWPMLILRIPTGWTCPRQVDGQLVEGTFRAHGLPVGDPRGNPEHLQILEQWLRSYGPNELFGAAGGLSPEVTAICPRGERRIGRNPHADGGKLRGELDLPSLAGYALDVASPGSVVAEATPALGDFLRDTVQQNLASCDFRVFCPDDAITDRLPAVLEATGRVWMWPVVGTDEHLSPEGRILEIHDAATCQGWLEGYLLTGRHGLLVCRESSLVAMVPAMQQYLRWLEGTRATAWRTPVASLTCLVVADSGMQGVKGIALGSLLAVAGDLRTSPLRVCFPPDANSLLCVVEQCLRSLARVNVVFTCVSNGPQWLGLQAAGQHCARGASVWDWVAHDSGHPDVVLADCG